MRHADGWNVRVVCALLALTLLGGCGGQSGLELGDSFVATLDVTIDGTGSGKVVAAGQNEYDRYNFECRTAEPDCSDSFDLDADGAATFLFTATADAGSVFAGWDDDCIASALDPTEAEMTMDVETGYTCTATFDLDPVANACTNSLVIQDDFSTDAGWTTSLTANNGNVTQAVAVQASGGSPGGFRRMQHIFTGQSLMATYHAYGAVTYNPSTQGAIDHVNYSEDQIVIDPPFFGAAVGTGFTMTQGGIRYAIIMNPPGAAFTNLTWQKSSRVDLTAADFPGIDFSATGGPITFGYFRSNSNDGGSAITVTHGIDNFRVEVCR